MESNMNDGVTDKQKAWIVTLFNKGEFIKDIAKTTRVKRGTVARVLREAGYDTLQGSRGNSRFEPSPEDIRRETNRIRQRRGLPINADSTM